MVRCILIAVIELDRVNRRLRPSVVVRRGGREGPLADQKAAVRQTYLIAPVLTHSGHQGASHQIKTRGEPVSTGSSGQLDEIGRLAFLPQNWSLPSNSCRLISIEFTEGSVCDDS